MSHVILHLFSYTRFNSESIFYRFLTRFAPHWKRKTMVRYRLSDNTQDRLRHFPFNSLPCNPIHLLQRKEVLIQLTANDTHARWTTVYTRMLLIIHFVHVVGEPDPWKWSCWYHFGGGDEGLIPRVPGTITYTNMYDGLSEGQLKWARGQKSQTEVRNVHSNRSMLRIWPPVQDIWKVRWPFTFCPETWERSIVWIKCDLLFCSLGSKD